MSWIALSIWAGFVWALGSISDKFVLSKLVKKSVVPVIMTGAVGFIGGIISILVKGLEPLPLTHLLLALLAGFFFIMFAIFYFKAAQIEEVSRVTPLFYLSTLFTALIAGIFLGEIFTFTKYIGIALLFAGAMLISLRKPYSIRLGKAFWFMVLMAIFFASNWVITKYLVTTSDVWTVFAYTRIGGFITLLPIVWINRSALKETYAETKLKAYSIMTIKEFVTLSGVLSVTIAATSGYITLISALTALHMLFVLVFTIFLSLFLPRIIKEDLDKNTVIIKVIATSSTLAGVYLVS